MVGATARKRGYACWLGPLVLAVGLGGQPAAAQDDVPGATSRVRAMDKKAAELLRAGAARSATFRHLTEAIDRSDLVVYVETRRLALPGQLQFHCATPLARYVVVSVGIPGLDNDLLAWLAHELRHAVEIAGAPEVREPASLRRFYDRVGRSARADGGVQMETRDAQETQAQVLGELRRGNE